MRVSPAYTPDPNFVPALGRHRQRDAKPPEMVKGLKTMISEAGVDDDDIRAKEFAGY